MKVDIMYAEARDGAEDDANVTVLCDQELTLSFSPKAQRALVSVMCNYGYASADEAVTAALVALQGISDAVDCGGRFVHHSENGDETELTLPYQRDRNRPLS